MWATAKVPFQGFRSVDKMAAGVERKWKDTAEEHKETTKKNATKQRREDWI